MLLETAVALTSPGITISVFEALDEVPVFDEDWENPPPPGVAYLHQRVASADGLLIAEYNEYNQSVPGVVKNYVDWPSRGGTGSLAGRAVAIIGTTVGVWGTRIAQTVLRQMLSSIQSLVLPHRPCSSPKQSKSSTDNR